MAGILPGVLIQQDLSPATRAAVAALCALRPHVQNRTGAIDITETVPKDIVTETDVLVQNEIERVRRD